MMLLLKRLLSRDRKTAKAIKAERDTLRRWSERASTAKQF